MAREMFPGKANSLDALCRRFEVDNSGRSLHGALLDAGLLAEVYIRMTRGQNSLVIDGFRTSDADVAAFRFGRVADSYAAQTSGDRDVGVVGLAFKISAAPFHMWTPDVYQGAPTSVTAFMSAATKTAAFVVLLRLLNTAFPSESDIWTIAIANRSTGASFTITLPYPSSYATAEWVIETPVVITDTGDVQVGPMPDLTGVRFDHARVNGASAAFVASERMDLVDFDLTLIATPSLPDHQGDGFNDCTYAATCPAP